MKTVGSEIKRIQATGKAAMLYDSGGFPLAWVRPDDSLDKLGEQLLHTIPLAYNWAYRRTFTRALKGYGGYLDCARVYL